MRRDLILRHFGMIVAGFRDDPKFVIHKTRTSTGWYAHGLPNGRLLRQRINDIDSIEEYFEAVGELFSLHAAA